jgi:hypothetical protein
MAVLGTIPSVGGFLSAAAGYKAEEGALRADSLQTHWLEEHHAQNPQCPPPPPALNGGRVVHSTGISTRKSTPTIQKMSLVASM